MNATEESKLIRPGTWAWRWMTLERRLGFVAGVYRVPRRDRLGPWGLFYIGSMGLNSSPGRYKEIGYWRSWRGVRGLEVTVLGCSAYFMAVPRG